ncbi:PAC2 family protein [Bombiscardovia coagulans]|uniref:PAC2 family n=1 Tax=Bombiscardovia coagulans TaxID=686666 RepID=A0A261EVM4_9BIFI|nr:PAC2 family protein [Bombiscardovia coagulans]OZG50908.1 PAC2 family [Bombiscardovia coagulans]
MKEESETQLHHAMIAAFEGWNDACSASTNVIHHLLNTYPSQEVGSLDSDGFYDYQVSRPMLCHVQGRRNIYWPETKFYEVSIQPECKLLVEVGPEPNYHWIDYCRQSIRFAEDLEINTLITLGSMFADCPHTRDLPIDDLAGDQIDADTEGHSGPVGIPTVLDAVAVQSGFKTESLWVSVPQYMSSDECAQGTLQLLRRVSRLLGIRLSEGDLPDKAQHWQAQASVLVRCNDNLAEYVHRLEVESDAKAASNFRYTIDEPLGDELAQEAEEFLKSVGGQDTPSV